MLEAMRAMGAPAKDIERVAEAIEQQRAAVPTQPEEFGVYRDNWATVQAWIALETQWNWLSPPVSAFAGVGMPVRTGLNYAGVAAWLELFVPARQRRSVMQGLMLMERAGMAALIEIRKQEEG